MKSKLFLGLSATITFIVVSSCSKDENVINDSAVVIAATGDINARLDEFRQLLGAQLNTTPGAVAGRREVHWDAIPEQLLNTKLTGRLF